MSLDNVESDSTKPMRVSILRSLKLFGTLSSADLIEGVLSDLLIYSTIDNEIIKLHQAGLIDRYFDREKALELWGLKGDDLD